MPIGIHIIPGPPSAGLGERHHQGSSRTNFRPAGSRFRVGHRPRPTPGPSVDPNGADGPPWETGTCSFLPARTGGAPSGLQGGLNHPHRGSRNSRHGLARFPGGVTARAGGASALEGRGGGGGGSGGGGTSWPWSRAMEAKEGERGRRTGGHLRELGWGSSSRPQRCASSTSRVPPPSWQRRLKIGYGGAARIMDVSWGQLGSWGSGGWLQAPGSPRGR